MSKKDPGTRQQTDSERRNIRFTRQTYKQLLELCELYGETQAKVISRCIQDSYNCEFPGNRPVRIRRRKK